MNLSFSFITFDEAIKELVTVNDSAKKCIKYNLQRDGEISKLNRVENYIRDIEKLVTAIHKELEL